MHNPPNTPQRNYRQLTSRQQRRQDNYIQAMQLRQRDGLDEHRTSRMQAKSKAMTPKELTVKRFVWTEFRPHISHSGS